MAKIDISGDEQPRFFFTREVSKLTSLAAPQMKRQSRNAHKVPGTKYTTAFEIALKQLPFN